MCTCTCSSVSDITGLPNTIVSNQPTLQRVSSLDLSQYKTTPEYVCTYIDEPITTIRTIIDHSMGQIVAPPRDHYTNYLC